MLGFLRAPAHTASLYSAAMSRTETAAPPPFDLSRPLVRLSERDAWTIGDACEGTQILGATGSGKTSGSGRRIAKAMLAEGFGGLVLTAKPDERQLWQQYCAETGRSDALLIVGPGRNTRFDFLDYELKRATTGAGLTENVVNLFTAVIEAVNNEAGGGAGLQDAFWDRALRQLLRNAVDLLVLAEGRVNLRALSRLIASAPQHPDQIHEPAWQQRSDCYKALEAASARYGAPEADPVRRGDLEVTTDYWLGEFPALADRTRSSIVATFTTMADGFLRGQLRELFCNGTTIIPELTHHGAVIVVDLPIKHYQDLGRAAQVILKTCWQRATEARDVAKNPRPVFLWADEAQNFATRRDMDFQATARSARACTVYLTQSLSSYVATFGGSAAKAAADALVGNLQTKILHAGGDETTNEWAERLLGKAWAWRINTSSSSQQAGGPQQQNGDGRSTTAGASESFDARLAAGAFTTLAKGGPASNFQVEAVVFQGGRTWQATGTNFIRVRFDQRT